MPCLPIDDFIDKGIPHREGDFEGFLHIVLSGIRVPPQSELEFS